MLHHQYSYPFNSIYYFYYYDEMTHIFFILSSHLRENSNIYFMVETFHVINCFFLIIQIWSSKNLFDCKILL